MKHVISLVLILSLISAAAAFAVEDVQSSTGGLGKTFTKTKVTKRGAQVSKTVTKTDTGRSVEKRITTPKGAKVEKTKTVTRTDTGKTVTGTRTVTTPKGKTITKNYTKTVTRPDTTKPAKNLTSD